MQFYQPAVEENQFREIFRSMLNVGDDLMDWEFSTVFNLLFDFTPRQNFDDLFLDTSSRCYISPVCF